jgi:hypothetical protein
MINRRTQALTTDKGACIKQVLRVQTDVIDSKERRNEDIALDSA